MAEQAALLHAACYATSTSPIKDDVAALAACWKSGAGPLTKQEAGLLLWWRCQSGEDGCAEVLGANVVTPCLDTLATPSALAADKSTAAGLLHALCSNETREQVARSKASGAGGASCFAVLHACLSKPEAVPRHVVAVLASLAGFQPGLNALLKAVAGVVPWRSYAGLLDASHKSSKDHATAIAAATLIQCLVTGRDSLALEAAGAGVLTALLDCMRGHKSAAAVQASASCLQAMCQAVPQLRGRLGELPGAVQHIMDLLGPPPAAVIAWEHARQELLAQQHQQQQGLPAPSPPTAAATGSEQRGGWQHTSSTMRAASSNGSSSSQLVRASGVRIADSIRSRAPSGAGDAPDTSDAAAKVAHSESTLTHTRRKSLRILDVPEGEAVTAGSAAAVPSSDHGTNLRSKSTLGCLKQGAGTSKGNGSTLTAGSASGPHLCQPLLSTNSTALKWDGPVPDATRAAVAGLLAELVMLPHLAAAASARLAASRLAALLTGALQHLAEASAGKKGGKKGAASKLTVPPEAEALLTHVCVCLELLVAGDSADCFRVAAGGGLPGLRQLAAESRNTRLRRAAKAVVAQVELLAEAQPYMQQAGLSQEGLALVRLQLADGETRQLLVEHPSCGLQALDEVTARARPKV